MGFFDTAIKILPTTLLAGGGAGVGFALGGPAGAALGGTMGMSAGQSLTNFFAQSEQFEYQKRLQQQMFYREDNATQRRTADLIKAGLSPTLAAGSSAGSGPVVPVNAPQMADTASTMLGLISGQKNIAMQDAQIAKLNAEKANTDWNSAEKLWNLNYYKKFGIPTNMGGYVNQVTGASNAIEAIMNRVKDYENNQNTKAKQQYEENMNTLKEIPFLKRWIERNQN